MNHTHIKKLLLILSVSLFLSLQTCSLFVANTSDDDGNERETSILVETTLYKITEDTPSHASKVGATIYMIGSIHVGKKSYTFPSLIEEKFSESDVFVMETLLPTSAEEEGQLLTTFFDVARDNKISQNVVDPNKHTYNTLKGYVNDYSGDANFYTTHLSSYITSLSPTLALLQAPKIDETEPTFLDYFLEQSVMEELGYESANGVDTYFYNKAKDTNKVLKALESNEDVLKASFDVDIDEQTLAVIENAKAYLNALNNKTDPEIEKLVTAYATNDEATWRSLSTISDNDDSFFKEMLTDRNKEWVTTLKDLIKNRGTGQDVFFVVVGWAHTVTLEESKANTHSFQRLLDDDGFSVEIVSQK